MRTVGFIPECTPLSSVPPASERETEASEGQEQEQEQEQEEEQPKKGRVKNGDKR